MPSSLLASRQLLRWYCLHWLVAHLDVLHTQGRWFVHPSPIDKAIGEVDSSPQFLGLLLSCFVRKPTA